MLKPFEVPELLARVRALLRRTDSAGAVVQAGGLRLDRLGRSSITYGIGLFAPGAERAAATARFVHVCVDRASGRPVAVPEGLRRALAALA